MKWLKGAIHSKTMWCFAVNFVLLSFGIYSDNYIIDPRFQGFIMGMGGLILRHLTDKALRDK